MQPLQSQSRKSAFQKYEPEGTAVVDAKRVKRSEESKVTLDKTQALTLEKFGIPTNPRTITDELESKGAKILERLEEVEWHKEPNITMLLTEPGVVLKSITEHNIVSRSLAILKFGQQDPDWFDRMSEVWQDIGKMSEYAESNSNSLARGSYVRAYNALAELIPSASKGIDQNKIDKLTQLLFYADCFMTIKSSKPSYNARSAITLFELHEFVKKFDLCVEHKAFDDRATIGKLYTILGIKSDAPRDYLFTAAECDSAKWTQEAFEALQQQLCAVVEEQGWHKKIDQFPYESYTKELAERIASYHLIVDAE